MTLLIHMNKTNTNIKNIENTFLPRCRSKKLSIDALVTFVLHGFCSINDLPKKVKKPVLEAIKNKTL